MSDKKDQLYRPDSDTPSNDINTAVKGSFKFDARVAEVFNDMISRSVPGYRQILEMLPTLVKQLHQNHGNYYDLGCSLGAGMLAIAQGLSDTDYKSGSGKIIGIDNSTAMLKHARDNLLPLSNTQFELHQQNLQDTDINNAAMVLMNFTLQFIPLTERDALVQKIHAGLTTGGAFIVSEKIKFQDNDTQQLFTDIHHQYKADQGYSQLEIAQKRDAIENVLIPETVEAHIKRLTKAGFSVISPWVQNLQFISILAVK